MKILITGVAGFIGSNLAEHLLRQGDKVSGLDNFITSCPENIKRLSTYQNFIFFEADISNPHFSQKASLGDQKFDEIYHLACPTGVPNLVPLAEEMLLACSYGTKNILDIAGKTKARFLFTSSSEVYGDPAVFPQKEEYTGNVSSTGWRSPYEEGKRFAESLTSTYARKYGLEAKLVRVFNTYGPNMCEKDSRVIPRFIRQLEEDKPLTIHGDGAQSRTFCYIEDLIEALVLVIKKGKSGQVYNVGSAEQLSIKDLAELMSKIYGSRLKVKYEIRPAHDHQARVPSLEKIKRLGWKPKTSLEKGLQKTFHFLKEELLEDLPAKVS